MKLAKSTHPTIWGVALGMILGALQVSVVEAAIPGTKGVSFALQAQANYISTPDGGVHYMWLWQDATQLFPQYPGPTIIVDQSSSPVAITVENRLTGQPAAMPVSLTAPGLNVYCSSGACTTSGVVDVGQTGIYSFIPNRPGTFQYYSDHRTDVGVAMGLVGAIIVRPSGFRHIETDLPVPASGPTQKAYGSTQTVYDHEYLMLVTDLDVDYHQTVTGAGGQPWTTCANIGLTSCPDQATRIDALTEAIRAISQITPGGRFVEGFFPEYWFVNGRAAFDNFQASLLPWLPTQPYEGISLSHPGETTLIRFVGAGRQIHPFHPHGDETSILAVDGRLLHAGGGNSVTPPGGAAPNLQFREYTNDQIPGQTVDATWNWMPVDLGFDVYGNAASAYTGVTCPVGKPDDVFVPHVTNPLCIIDVADRGKPLPTAQPPLSDLVFGGFWSGSAFLGGTGTLPPGEGGLNPFGALSFIWHSHREKELINNDVFPGGLLSTHFVVPYTFEGGNVPIPRGACYDVNHGRGCP